MEKSEFNKVFGEFVRSKRLENNWTQDDLADRLQNNFQNVSRLERGEITPSLYFVSKLADAFEMELDEFTVEFKSYLK